MFYQIDILPKCIVSLSGKICRADYTVMMKITVACANLIWLHGVRVMTSTY